ncbi:carboxypeptidase-like regulatory domain-containing protein [Pontibacter sp. KCTC 32443]|uniref:carboxypeptidase-like regulatory domain-containing protein n=1 Tax=Pontibacter TaxID=323449 RepID=UPI00164EAFA9|nr:MULTISPECIES: carboxypeptidase-like regulatory domain-containing protein [Pontibacter]MBC5775551.1 carboxypeptidase-like regulatory domain-containing protein [Pontibacter sp. KCTC 32443]
MHRYLYFFRFTLVVLLFASAPALAQRSVRISGTVLSSDKKTPVPGAGVIRYGTTKAVISDAEGKFLIDVEPDDTLLIRAVGYKPLLYLPQRLPVSEMRVNIVLQEDSIMLGEVEVTNRPSEEMIQRALRNMNRPDPNYTKNPAYVPAPKQTPPPPPPPPTVLTPISLLYDLFSREGKELRKLQELYLIQEFERRKKEQEEYNRFFKDNTGYEEKKK